MGVFIIRLNLFMQKHILPAPESSILSQQEIDCLIKHFFSNGTFDPRKWRNAKNYAHILNKLPGETLSEKIYTGIYGRSYCLTCGGAVKLSSFTAGWEKFCSRSCAQKHPDVRSKIKKTTLDRYGGETVWDIPGMKEKIAANISRSKKQARQHNIISTIKPDLQVELVNGEWHWTHSCGTKWVTSICRKKMSCPKCASSKPELELIDFVKSIVPSAKIKHRDRTILAPKELDIVINDTFAIEYNGAYHHRDNDPKIAQNKVINAAKLGIRLFTVLESDWKHNRKKVEAKISSYLKPLQRIGARRLSVCAITKQEAKTFLLANHFSGSAGAREFYGLKNPAGQLLCLATFAPARFTNQSNSQWELIRLCTAPGIVVQGGISKLVKHWKQLHPDCELISYHDLRFGWSDSLKNAGFKLEKITKPGWRWVKGDVVLERWETQKRKIKNIIPDADLSKTEAQIMKAAGWIQEYNVGNAKWRLDHT